MANAIDFRPTRPDRRIQSIHPVAVRIAVVAAAWFVVVMAISFSGTIESDYLMAVTIAFSVIFFGLVLGLAARAAGDPRWGGRSTEFRNFVNGKVEIATGIVSGRESLIQLLALPIVLAIGATAIGLIFVLLQ